MCVVGSTGMPKTIGRDEVQKLAAAGAQIVDVLPRDEYSQAHLPGAISLSLKELTPDFARARLHPGTPIVVYCHDPT
jgi:rhodanese-related sulfurtransferase